MNKQIDASVIVAPDGVDQPDFCKVAYEYETKRLK